ncbi:NADH-quinone oxidoreductase subunit J [Sedimenticola sp.]|uniref:NADH-quinone oxidoreductase subunit J n=1 Tax=Sedimenticola sp. TaxID=1940285 RepID=UPI002586D4CB|nr:NADH-quinone oxidoreductase subunit J [Sedimenticola sp.]MCW8903324.1 NADH-quinone oxidoreductase subunit J [Sedimenticola sp.]
MTFEKFVFYLFAAILVFAATMVITRRNPVHSALFLVLAFFSSAGIWLLAEAEFLAIVLILVYVGAVMVLFLFVVMMLDIDLATLRAGFIRYMPVGALVALVMAVEIFMVVGPGNFGLDKVPAPAAQPAGYNNTEELGSVLYTVYMYPFEVAAVILLVGIIAAIGLTLRRRPETKYQNPSLQVRVKKADRLRVIKMDAED